MLLVMVVVVVLLLDDEMGVAPRPLVWLSKLMWLISWGDVEEWQWRASCWFRCGSWWWAWLWLWLWLNWSPLLLLLLLLSIASRGELSGELDEGDELEHEDEEEDERRLDGPPELLANF